MPKNFKIYLTVVILTGLSIMAYFLSSVSIVITPMSMLFTIVLILSDMYEFTHDSRFAFSMGCSNTIFIIVFFGPGAALVALTISSLITAIKRFIMYKPTKKMAIIKFLFNISQFAISVAAAHFMLHLLAFTPFASYNLIKMIIVILAYNAFNMGLVGIVVSLQKGELYMPNISGKTVAYIFYSFILSISLIYGYADRGILGAALIYLIFIPLQNFTKLAFNLKVKKEELEAKNKELITDTLTKTYNYKFLEQTIQEKITNKERFSLIFIDLDKFKKINDTYGHSAGNVAIQHVANYAKKIVGENGYVCRYGGDEFALIIDNNDIALKVADDIISNEECKIINYNDQTFGLCLSVGVYDYETKEHNFLDIINEADEAMYTAKKLGGNRVVKCN